MEERRQYERFDLKLPVHLTIVENGRQEKTDPLNLLTKDVCAGGAYLEGAAALPEGTHVSLDLVLELERLKKVKSNRAMIHVSGKVIRHEEGTGLAICFDKNYRITAL